MNEARGCFDQIAHVPAILVLMRFGVTYTAATTLFTILQKSRHRIMTGFGVLEPDYGDEPIPISGIGQGNRLGPTLWALISTVIILMCHRAGHGITCVSAISKKSFSFLGFSFVDDADLAQTADNINSPGEELIPDFQAFMNRWNGGIRASGGLIATNKTRWFLVDFK